MLINNNRNALLNVEIIYTTVFTQLVSVDIDWKFKASIILIITNRNIKLTPEIKNPVNWAKPLYLSAIWSSLSPT